MSLFDVSMNTSLLYFYPLLPKGRWLSSDAYFFSIQNYIIVDTVKIYNVRLKRTRIKDEIGKRGNDFFFFTAILQKAQGLKKGWGHFILNIKVFGN